MQLATKRHVQYAMGYLALGLANEASDELESIVEHDRFVPEVLLAKVELLLETKHWETLVGVGRELAQQEPRQERGWIGWAYALRELGRIDEAKAVLFDAERYHGSTSAVLHYNLACYHCLLRELDEARCRLKRAFELHPPYRKEAYEDTDLKALWAELERLT